MEDRIAEGKSDVKLDVEQVKELLKRGPGGFIQDATEFSVHLRTITDSIDSLLQEYPLLIMANAKIRITFDIKGQRIVDNTICFGDKENGKGTEL